MRFPLSYRESILTVVCDDGLRDEAFDALMEARFSIESKIAEDPFFGMTYYPYEASPSDDDIVRRMCEASKIADVGPMAGVAGAVAVHIAERLVSEGSSHAVVENGGDIAFYSPEPRLVGIFADHPVFRGADRQFNYSPGVGHCFEVSHFFLTIAAQISAVRPAVEGAALHHLHLLHKIRQPANRSGFCRSLFSADQNAAQRGNYEV